MACSIWTQEEIDLLRNYYTSVNITELSTQLKKTPKQIYKKASVLKLGKNLNHNLRKHPIYSVWASIKTRCYNSNNHSYSYYGGRGIKLSSEFHQFLVFYNYVTELPNYRNRLSHKLTLDRIDNNKDYERSNLRWSTMKEQCNNQRAKTMAIPTKVGKLTVVRHFIQKQSNYVECLCECGNSKILKASRLTKSAVKSCGCLVSENCARLPKKSKYFFKFDGEDRTLKELSEITGLSRNFLYHRLVTLNRPLSEIINRNIVQ